MANIEVPSTATFDGYDCAEQARNTPLFIADFLSALGMIPEVRRHPLVQMVGGLLDDDAKRFVRELTVVIGPEAAS